MSTHAPEFTIITYQVITGNYSVLMMADQKGKIITYQVITGNYSDGGVFMENNKIITYQVITGNYSQQRLIDFLNQL